MNSSLKQFLMDLNQGKNLLVDGVVCSASAYLVEKIAAQANEKTILLVTSTPETARQLFDDCEVFFKHENAKLLRYFPAPDVLPYTQLSPNAIEWAERIDLLFQLRNHKPLIIIAPIAALLRKLPPRSFIADVSAIVRVGDEINRENFIEQLNEYAYEEVALVETPGSFAKRGAIVDIWPPSKSFPLRIELEENHIQTIKEFHPNSQRSRNSKENLQEVQIPPVREFIFTDKTRQEAIERIHHFADDSNLPAREHRTLVENLRAGIAFSGINTFLPAFHSKTETLLDYLPEQSIIITDQAIDTEDVGQKLFTSVSDLYKNCCSREQIIPANLLYDNFSDWQLKTFKHQCIIFNGFAAELPNNNLAKHTLNFSSNADLKKLVDGHQANEDMLIPLVTKLRQWLGEKNLIVFNCHTQVQAERLTDLLSNHGLHLIPFDAPFHALTDLTDRGIRLRVSKLSAGFRWEDEKIILINDHEIFGSKRISRAKAKAPSEAFTSFEEIATGDLLVHQLHGIGRYAGLKHLAINNEASDYMLLEYLSGDKLYLPVYRMNLVQRYIGPGSEIPPLDKLGGNRWSNLQQKVRQEIKSIAKELLAIYAERKLKTGFAFPSSDIAYEEFCAGFPYDETPDQEKSIDETICNMESSQPMDRLICGDVGYGKTEVAMRAAFKAAMAGKQVAILVPTTVLAFQHFENFQERFKDTPLNIGMISRFRTRKEQQETLAQLATGKVDIIIGTHRLLQKDVCFRDLGLLIVDEEQRFGVVHKERIKEIKSTVDVLTLTATPIPRTLNFSLIGLRDISIINTPPANRHAISTHVAPFDHGVIRHAIKQELDRQGQVFFVHNRVQTIQSMYDRLKTMVPEARIVIGHGQMKEHALEKVMIDFLHNKHDVLLCTTIIESGLDIQNANTIIVNRADTFGLAQLYQLRGRVGRSAKHAFSYLLIPEEGKISAIAKRRLNTLQRYTELGSGFQIAMHDLEIRGAGNILGSSQSGHVAAVGYELYTKLLERTIRKMRNEEVLDEIDPELNLKLSAFLPENYIEDDGTRIELYRRIANRENEAEITQLGQELEDRFGKLPPEALNLLGIMKIKILAKEARIITMNFDGQKFSCQLDKDTPLDPQKLLNLASMSPELFRLRPPQHILLVAATKDTLGEAKKLLSTLLKCVSDDPNEL